MADTNVSVFDMATSIATRNLVPDPGADNHVPITNGSAITSPSFLSGGQAGQEQVIISTGDQSILIDKTQNTTIKEKRVTDVGKDETYTNKENYDRSVLGEHGHIVGENELKLTVGDNYIKIDKTSIILSINGKKVITMNGHGITLTVDGDKIIAMDADSISSRVGRYKSITIDGEGIFSSIDGGKCMVAMDANGITSSVEGSNFTRVHKGGVDTKGKLVKINDPGEE
jgi:hypothetical protein